MATPVEYYRRRPTVVPMIEWTGSNYDDVDQFCGAIPDSGGVRAFEPGNAYVPAKCWNTEERCWVNVPRNHRIVRGARNELYPISPEALAATYEPAR